MTLHAGWPGWMTVILIMALMGPMMRMMFGGPHFPPHPKKRLKGKAAAEELARVDEALAERDEVIEDLQRRLSEMESRLDFTERLLARTPGASASHAEAVDRRPPVMTDGR